MTTPPRHRLPATRHGPTRLVRCGPVRCYVTVNRDGNGNAREMFIKASHGWQGWADALALTASLYLQRGGTLRELLLKWRAMRFEPQGIAGQGASVPDGIARAWSEEWEQTDERKDGKA